MNILEILYFIIIFLTAAFGFFRFKKHSAVFRLLIILLSISFVSEMSGRYVGFWRHNSMPFDHAYALVEYLILTSIYLKILHGVIRKIILALIAPMCIFSLFNSFYLQGINNFPSNFLLICELLYMCYAFFSFRQMLLQAVPVPFYKQSLFWLNLAQVIFSTTLFINFGLANYLISHQLFSNLLVLFINLVNLIYVILLSIAIIIDGNTSKYFELNGEYQQ